MRVFVGTFIDTEKFGSLNIYERHVMSVDLNGLIIEFRPQLLINDPLLQDPGRVKFIKDNEFFIPGFVDCHFHAPQYINAGTATDLPLFDWLEKYTFPTERSFDNPKIAQELYSRVIKDTLNHGTTTALYFGTLHLESSKLFSDIVENYGQRGFIGKVSMDQNSLNSYKEDTQQAINDAENFVKYVLAKNNPLVQPVITPRFIPTCSFTLLKALAEIARKYNVTIQSHMSESRAQVEYTKELYPNFKDGRDVSIFQASGLLYDKSVMAHATFLTTNELEILRQTGVAVAHCPLSNFYFGDDLFKVKRAITAGNKIGLGTDISGGYSPSMLNAIRNAVICSNVISQQENPIDSMDFKEAFWLSTMGGAISLNISHKIGSFTIGKCFDALLINYSFKEPDRIYDRFQRFINLGDDRNIKEVYVQGKPIKPQTLANL
jgi:guanine deaminase